MSGNSRKGGLVLQERDRGLLAEVALMRIIDREQAKLVAGFRSTTRANTRLLKLTRAGLTADRDEEFVFITGAEVDGAAVLDQMIELRHEKRSVGGVTADARSTHGLLIRLEQFRHRLLATFHSHPNSGPSGTTPSGIDQNFQERLERAGHRAVMAIFSRDGFVRFLRLDQNFEIEIFGEGVEKHAPNIYKLTNIDSSQR